MSNEIKQDLNIKKQNFQSDDLNYNQNIDTDSQSQQQSYEAMGDFILDTRNLDNQEVNTSKFKKGIDEYSTIAGNMAVLTSMGIDSKVALEFVERKLIREHELELIALR